MYVFEKFKPKILYFFNNHSCFVFKTFFTLNLITLKNKCEFTAYQNTF